jgi:hypothetical protein
LARWFGGDGDAAVKVWREGLKCGYKAYGRLDVLLILFFALLERPDMLGPGEAKGVLRMALHKASPDTEPALAARTLLGELTEEEFARLVLARPAVMHRAQRQVEADVLVNYYLGLKRLQEDDRCGCTTRMNAAASARGLLNLWIEDPIAVCVTQFGSPQ